MAAGDDRFTKERVDVNSGLVQEKPRRVVTGSRVWIDEADRLALQFVDVLVRTVYLYIDDRVIADRAIIVAGRDERLGLHLGQMGLCVGRWTVISDLNIAGTLTFDDRRVIIGDAQFDRDAEFL